MAKPPTDNTVARYIPADSRCSWCGHPPHATTCTKTIRRSKNDSAAPCPCAHPKETP